MSEHECSVRLKTDAAACYRVMCATCGPVGVPMEYLGDAEAIAERHEELGGFERAR